MMGCNLIVRLCYEGITRSESYIYIGIRVRNFEYVN